MADYFTISDAQLLAQCRFEAFRGSGPGGQKRNKTSSSVRLTHEPTGLVATAGESRSQQQNRLSALRRLRHRLAMEIRGPFVKRKLSLDVSMRSAEYLVIMSWVLDALAEAGWSISEAAAYIGISTAQLSGFLRRDEKLWAHVNQHRAKAGLKGLV
jgi:hypothetical protein